jgi:hypothetical protein
VGAGVMAAMFAVIWFAPMIAILYCGISVWPRIAIFRQLPMFKESKTSEPSS